ncbi:MAG: divalent-cation tolerance protein CutA [Chthoniobacterales bacterium]
MPDETFLAFSTFPDAETARRIARELVNGKLVACANILPQAKSIYRWQGKLEQSTEVLVLFKLRQARYSEFEAKLKELHPYDVPEIVAVPIATGSRDYLDWIAQSCS